MKVGLLAITIALLLPFGAMAGPAPDQDSDGTVDVLDICSLNADAPHPCALDADNDGFGNACDGDLNNDGATNASDSQILINKLSPGSPVDTCTSNGTSCECVTNALLCDFNCDGAVNASDSNIYINAVGNPTPLINNPPGPSGLPCAGTVPCP